MQRVTSVMLLLAMFIASAAPSEGAWRSDRQDARRTAQQTDTDLIVRYVRGLPIGSRVRVELSSGDTIKGTLMAVEEEQIVVKRRTRLPEQPLRIAFKDIGGVEIEKNGSGVGKAIAVGAAAGAGAALAVFMIILATIAD